MNIKRIVVATTTVIPIRYRLSDLILLHIMVVACFIETFGPWLFVAIVLTVSAFNAIGAYLATSSSKQQKSLERLDAALDELRRGGK